MVGGREVQAGRNVYVHAADSLLRVAETNTAFCKATIHQYIFLSVCFIFFQYLFAWSLKDPQLHKGVLSFMSLSIQKYCTINILHITAEAASELCPGC